MDFGCLLGLWLPLGANEKFAEVLQRARTFGNGLITECRCSAGKFVRKVAGVVQGLARLLPGPTLRNGLGGSL